MDPLVASTLISTGGKLVGGLFGKKKGPSPEELARQERRNVSKMMDLKMQLAERHKIHPLTMLGAGLPQVTSPVYTENSSDNMGQNIVEAVSSGASQYFSGKAQEEMNKLALERAGLENELLRSQITSINNPQTAGSAYSNDQRVLNHTAPKNTIINPDENTAASSGPDKGLTAGSDLPPPSGKKFIVGSTPYGNVYITLPPSGQADEYGEVYGAIKGLEYLAKRGYVHYSNGTYRAGKKLGHSLRNVYESGKKFVKEVRK